MRLPGSSRYDLLNSALFPNTDQGKKFRQMYEDCP